MTEDTQNRFSRESVQVKVYLSADADVALRAASTRTTWSMSTIVDMLIKAHAPMLGVSLGITEAVRQYENAEEAYKAAASDAMLHGMGTVQLGALAAKYVPPADFLKPPVEKKPARSGAANASIPLRNPSSAASARTTLDEFNAERNRVKKDFDFDDD